MKIYILLIYMAFIFFSLEAQVVRKEDNIAVLIYDNTKEINVYSSCNGDKKVNYLKNDTVNENYYIIEILGSKNNRYQIVATSISHRDIKGWIDLNNIGINTRQLDFKVMLYRRPNYDAEHVVAKEEVDSRIVRVTAISSNWLKIIWIDGEEYWLPSEYQCSNPYTTCN